MAATCQEVIALMKNARRLTTPMSVFVSGLLLITVIGTPVFAAAAPPDQESRLDWWTDARFGMFIHWGLYSAVGCHWHGQNGRSAHMMYYLKIPLKEYATIADEFNPVRFNADEWVRIAKDAGMKYMVITSKHHEGFAMYNSKVSDYNIIARTPWKHDPVKELAEACRRGGLKFGVYYSLGRDWEDPDVPTKNSYKENTWDYPDTSEKDFSKYFNRKVVPQVRELLTQYHPAILWFDTSGSISRSESEKLLRLIRDIDPNCIVNSRIGNRLGDYAVEEQKVPEEDNPRPWETCMTLNGHWAYYTGDDNWKSTEALVRHLVDIASKGGNFLLNVGPTDQGVIPEPSVQRLEEMGQWLKRNGESIYGTTAGPLQGLSWGRSTKKTTEHGEILYLHIFDWPADGKLVVPGLDEAFDSASLMADKTPLKMEKGSGAVTILLPQQAPDAIDTVVMLTEGR